MYSQCILFFQLFSQHKRFSHGTTAFCYDLDNIEKWDITINMIVIFIFWQNPCYICILYNLPRIKKHIKTTNYTLYTKLDSYFLSGVKSNLHVRTLQIYCIFHCKTYATWKTSYCATNTKQKIYALYA